MFSKKNTEAQRTNPQKALSKTVAARGNSTFSVIGADVSIKGDITASADLHVDGSVQGDITCASIVQGEESEISGAIVAQSARLAGLVKGSIRSRELVVLQSARIEGDVQYDALTIEQGAQVDGQFSHATQSAKPAAKTGASENTADPQLSVAS